MFDVHSNPAMNALANEAWSQQSTVSMQMLLQQRQYPHMPASSNNLVQYEPSLNNENPSQPPSEPKLSAYARWKLAEDEKFYTTFPEARYAADQYNTISSAYLVGTGYYYDEEGCIAMADQQTLLSLSTASITHESNATGNEHPQIHEHEPRYDIHYADSALARALDPTSRDVRPRSSTSACHNTPPPTPPPQSDPQPTCPTQTIESSNIVPQVPQVASIPEPPIMDSLRPPDFPNMSLSSYNPIQNVAPNLPSKSEYTYHHPSAGYTDPSLYDMAYIKSYNFYQSTSQVVWPTVCTPSPRCMPLSPLPPSRRPIAKKPPLACLFCRGRKIACGPPDPGSTDRSCNQCQRRSIKCEYPSESRRGIRKKKANLNPAGPKVRVGRKSRVMQ